MKATTSILAAALLSGAANLAAAQEGVPAPVATAPTWEQAIRRLPEVELKQLYVHCGRIAEKRPLASDEVFACSVAYDALLAGTFRGDYLALRAWSARTHGRGPAATPFD